MLARYVKEREAYLECIPMTKEQRITTARMMIQERLSSLVGPGYETHTVLPFDYAIEAFVEALAHLAIADGRSWGLPFPGADH